MLPNTEGSHGWVFWCSTCNKNQTAEPWYKVEVQLTDKSAMLTSTLYDKCAQKLLQVDSSHVHGTTKQETSNYLLTLNDELRGRMIIVEVKAAQNKYGDKKTRHTVCSWIESEHKSVPTIAKHEKKI